MVELTCHLKSMKKLLDRIKLDRKIALFLSNLVSCGGGGFDFKFKVVGQPDRTFFFCNMYKNKMVIRTYVFEEFSELKYNRYIHNKIVEFVGDEYDYVLYCDISSSDNVISIDEYEAHIR